MVSVWLHCFVGSSVLKMEVLLFRLRLTCFALNLFAVEAQVLIMQFDSICAPLEPVRSASHPSNGHLSATCAWLSFHSVYKTVSIVKVE